MTSPFSVSYNDATRVVDLVFEVVPAERTFLLLRDSADEAVTPRVLRHGVQADQIVCSRATLERAKRTYNATSCGMVSLRGRQGEMEVFEIN